MKRRIMLLSLASLLAALSGCGLIRVQDDYSLDRIDGDVRCEYRVGREAKWAEDCVDSDVRFDKERFLSLFREYCQYDPLIGSKDPMQCDLKIDMETQPEEWKRISESEFNVRAVFGGDQRDVSIYRYEGRLYFFVLSIGDRGAPEERGDYFVELSREMSDYWRTVIEAVEEDLPQ